MAIRITVWNEYRHEKEDDSIAAIYPDGIHGAIATGLAANNDFSLRVATMDEPENGLTEAILDDTDVLIWWGHKAHGVVEDATVDRVQARVLNGMGLIVLHSGHYSKIFKRLMGTSCSLKWRVGGDKERLWVIDPAHPIAEGIGEYIEIAEEEMYGEHFDIPEPDALVFVSWFTGGEIFRSGCCYHRGSGKIFYFRPGHETFPTYYNEDVLKVIGNAARWTAPVDRPRPQYALSGPTAAFEPLPGRS